MAQPEVTRREFVQQGSLLAAGAAATLTAAPFVHAAGSDEIKVGVIGCGGRGSGAAEDVLQAAPNVRIVALCDYFRNKALALRKRLLSFAESERVKQLGNKVDVPEDRCFGGLDGYRRVLECDVNYIILATPPGFRPDHLEACVAASKHIFTEKPVAVDGAGVRVCLKVYEDALKKSLGIAAGTQRRHQGPYIETIQRIHDGALGDPIVGRCYWNQGDIWFRKRESGMTDLDYQIHNWYHFVWLCGDHIVEQHVHNLDVMNWALRAHPLRCLGMGGRTRPYTDPRVDGHIYNFFCVEYEYPNGLRVHSMCRQITGCDGNLPGSGGVAEVLVGTKGVCQINNFSINGQSVVSRQTRTKFANPYIQEHTDLIESIRAGKPINELKNVAESTLTAIMGRMSAYTGKVVTWEQALNSKEKWRPEPLTPDNLPVPPLAVPGKTALV